MLRLIKEARSLPRSDRLTQPNARPAPSRRLAGFVLAPLLLLLAACGSLPGAPPASVDRAERLISQGNPAEAAALFERLAAENPPPDSTVFALRAVRAYIAANRATDAQRVYSTLTAPTGDPLANDYRLAGIEVLLARGEAAEAWRRAAALPVPRDRADQLRLYSLQRRVALAAGRPADGVQAGIAAERAAATDAERATARRDLLAQLRQAADRGVRLDPASARDNLARGWLELGQIAANAGRTPLSAAGEVDRWRNRFPGHPGSTIALADVMGSPSNAPVLGAAGTQVAVLLPLTGPVASSAIPVRDGINAAFGQLPEAQRPNVRVYDTGAVSVEAALATAQAEGAGFILGPLTRPEIIAAADHAPRGVPLLLLNYLPFDRAAGPTVYQFALSPEDEARQVARRALAFGQKRAIVFAPAGDWGNRVVAAFRDELTRGGGSVIVQAAYDAGRSEFTGAITSALKIEESRARHKRIEEITGSKLGFQERRRGDVQMIFAA
ncbi:MAG: penicillin-binding protein activator, partial [Steroidobacteraceae bacterium]